MFSPMKFSALKALRNSRWPIWAGQYREHTTTYIWHDTPWSAAVLPPLFRLTAIPTTSQRARLDDKRGRSASRTAMSATQFCLRVRAVLFVPQRHHRIHPHRTPRGNISGHSRNCGETQRNSPQCRRIISRHAEQQVPDQARSCKCAR